MKRNPISNPTAQHPYFNIQYSLLSGEQLHSHMIRNLFKNYLIEHNNEGSGKASSYLRALDLLSVMLRIKPYSFSDCADIWSVNSVERLHQLRLFVLDEQKNLINNPWDNEKIPPSYLRDGFCSAALRILIEFHTQNHYTSHVLETLKKYNSDYDALKHKLNTEPAYPDFLVRDPNSQDGKELIREAKVRIGQQAFRKMILQIYQNRCCITGLNIPTVNRASHIIPWAKRKNTRMDPCNGLCLSATYDAAFDRHLISLDKDYRLLVSRDISDHYSSQSVNDHFLQRVGSPIELPIQHAPKQKYLEEHRQVGNF